MIFSSISFLFFFLPFLLLVYFLVPKKYKNAVLLIFSLAFYYFGEKNYIFLLLFTSTMNYILGIYIDKTEKKSLLVFGIIFNLSILFYYKYANFFLDNITTLLGIDDISLKIVLPLGISFFTFQNLSYLIDVYKKETESEKNIFTYCTYISLFPQLIAGPILRYKDIHSQLENRSESLKKISDGITRFIIGLAKKVLIADTLYNSCISIMKTDQTAISYWLLALIFTFQIYYDFSGYSDMAIGLGKMFGFDFKENFNYPLISHSITEFWRRWHISLSTFFKDYVYIPLGGNRSTVFKNIRNIFIVWILTGMWHGASWNFIIWGMYFFIFLVLEKYVFKKILKKGPFSFIYTSIVLIISFVIFNTTDLQKLATFIKGLFGIGCNFLNRETIYFLKNNIVILAISIIGAGPLLSKIFKKIQEGKLKNIMDTSSILALFTIFFLCIARLISSSFNPFIYFRF